MSLIYNINSRGLSTQPCSTPNNTVDNRDEELQSETYCFCFEVTLLSFLNFLISSAIKHDIWYRKLHTD